MVEFKPCKGQNKAKSFDGCKNSVHVNSRKQGLCPTCYKRWLLTSDSGNEYLAKVRLKAKVTVEKDQRKKSREEKLAGTDYKVKLQSKINEIARLIDIGLPCLATGYHANQIQGGHVFSRGAEASMRFNLHNIHRQSAQSNNKHSDDVVMRENLIKEYGQEYFDFLNSLRQGGVNKFSLAEYRDFYKVACAIANRLRREGKRFTWRERIQERSKINLEIGIYPAPRCLFEI